MQQAKERFRKIIASQLYDILLVDNHFSVYENKQLVKAIDDEELALYDTLILVEVPIDILHKRISQDNKERTRESCDKEKIVQHRSYERSVAEELKKRYKRQLIEIENIDLKKAIEEIQEKIYTDPLWKS
jgi:adenylate kinase